MSDKFKQLEEVIEQEDVQVVFQPLVDLRTKELFAYEALARTKSPHFSGPPEMFDVAVQMGRAGELGRLVRKLAVEKCKDYPLFLNVHPDEFGDGWIMQSDDPIFFHHHQIYLEITESVPLKYNDVCHGILKEIRSVLTLAPQLTKAKAFTTFFRRFKRKPGETPEAFGVRRDDEYGPAQISAFLCLCPVLTSFSMRTSVVAE